MDITDCNFSKLDFLSEQQNTETYSSPINKNPLINDEDIRNILIPTKLSLYKKLGERIKTCFTKEKLLHKTPADFLALELTLIVLTMEPYPVFSHDTFHHWSCRCKDAESTVTIKINGIILIKDIDDNWTVSPSTTGDGCIDLDYIHYAQNAFDAYPLLESWGYAPDASGTINFCYRFENRSQSIGPFFAYCSKKQAAVPGFDHFECTDSAANLRYLVAVTCQKSSPYKCVNDHILLKSPTSTSMKWGYEFY